MAGEGRAERMAGGQSEVAPLGRVLLKHPKDAFQTREAIGEQWEALGYSRPPVLERAADEFDAFVSLLESLGARIEFLPSHPETGLDSLYARDASILTDRGAILCRMGKGARSGEPQAQGEALRALGVPILGEITGGGRVEGGDFAWLDEDTAVVGRGYRTNDEGIRQLRILLSDTTRGLIVVPLPHWRGPGGVFHLMSILSPVAHKLLLVYSPLLPVPFREHLLAEGFRLVDVPDAEFETMGGNVLAVAPGVCVMLAGNPVTRSRLEEAGLEVHLYRGEEISVPGSGGPTCLTRPLWRGD